MQTNLKEKLKEISKAVNPVIKKLLIQDVEGNTSDLVFYQCKFGGKRIRPALVILSGQIFGGDFDGLLYPAASIEILHNSTLIIDDIIDHSEFRRNQPTVWKKFGKSIAECVAIDYFATIFSGLSHTKNSSKLIDLYSKTLKAVVNGEISDILFERSGRDDEDYVVNNRYKTITKDDYFKMISQKTAVLLKTSCQAGAIYAGASDDQVELMGEVGFNIGIAFQIRDDILDIFGDEKKFGKKIGKDIIEKKMGNFVILTAIEQLGLKDKKTINKLLSSPKEITAEAVKIITNLIAKTDAKKTAVAVADEYIQKALDSLEKLPQNEANESLIHMTNYIVSRVN